MMKRFDEIEYLVLRCASPDGMGHIPKDPHRTRALLLMEEGIIKENPEDNWSQSGWKLTDKGLKHWNKFVNEVRKNHGHVWMTRKESDPDLYDGDTEYDNQIDTFAYTPSEYCNGPVCKNCGYGFCQHCTIEFEIDTKCAK